MRIAPHVVASLAEDDTSVLIRRVLADGITTHGHPRALLGAAVYAVALRRTLLRQGTLEYGDLLDHLIDDADWQAFEVEDHLSEDWTRAHKNLVGKPIGESWAATELELRELLSIAREALSQGALADDAKTLKELGCFDRDRNGAGTVTAVAAVYLATRNAPRPMAGLLQAAYLANADTDTLASMTSSILGALHGFDWLGTLGKQVQDHDYLVEIADRLGERATEPSNFPTPAVDQINSPAVAERAPFDRVTRQNITAFFASLDSKDVGSSGSFLDGRHYSVTAREPLETKSRIEARRWRLRLEDGQSIVIDRIRRLASKERQADSGGIDDSAQSPLFAEPSPPTINRTTPTAGRITSIGSPASDLSRLATFYREVLGLAVEGLGNGRIRVAGVLEFRRVATNDSGSAHEPIRVSMTTDQPEIIFARARSLKMSLNPSVSDRTIEFVIHDPEGNEIHVQGPRESKEAY